MRGQFVAPRMRLALASAAAASSCLLLLGLGQRAAGSLGLDLVARYSGLKIEKLQLQVAELLALLAVLLDALQAKRFLQASG